MMNAEDRTGFFLLSLDTELGWGYFDCFRRELFSSGGQRERETINLILDTLDEFGVIATWAVVGNFFLNHHKEAGSSPIMDWKERDPVFEELYESDSPVLYGADVIENLLTRGTKHEIAFHGYTHRVFLEKTMSSKEARAEIQAWSNIAARKKIIPKTAVFPRNKIGYLDLFKEHGFICYRGEELMPGIATLPVVGRVFRRFYHFFSLFSTPVTYEPQVDRSGLVNLPSSRWLFGFNRRVERILDGRAVGHEPVRGGVCPCAV